jgi:putative transposase
VEVPHSGKPRARRRSHVTTLSRALRRAAAHGASGSLVTAAAPNELWLTDITEHPTEEGKLYLCAVKDVYSGRIVGYSMDARMKSSLAVVRAGERSPGTPPGRDSGALRSRVPVPVPPLRRIPPAPRAHRLDGQGRCADNAAMESFFSLLQKNVLDRQPWLSRQDLRLAITTWIERTYHRRRRQRRLGKLTPIEYETINRIALTAA